MQLGQNLSQKLRFWTFVANSVANFVEQWPIGSRFGIGTIKVATKSQPTINVSFLESGNYSPVHVLRPKPAEAGALERRLQPALRARSL